jgi:hypothetical protein
LAAALLCSGCGSGQNGSGQNASPPPPTFSVTGEVRDEAGQPASKVLVRFVSERNPSLNTSAVTAADGTFTLTTSHGNQLLSGAVEGPCRVTLIPPFRVVAEMRTIRLPDLYQVTAETNHFVFRIPPTKAK